MSWQIEIKPSAEKQYLKLNGKLRSRVKSALQGIEKEEKPLLHPQVKYLTGKLKGDYRLRVGDLRVLLTLDTEKKVLYVYAIVQRGGAYR